MPRVDIKSDRQYEKAIDVLTRVGGTYQGIGYKERYLLVTLAQYDALVAAGVATPMGVVTDHRCGSHSKKHP